MHTIMYHIFLIKILVLLKWITENSSILYESFISLWFTWCVHISKRRYILTHTHTYRYTNRYTLRHTQPHKYTLRYTYTHRDRHDIHTYVLLMGRYPLRNMYKVTHWDHVLPEVIIYALCKVYPWIIHMLISLSHYLISIQTWYCNAISTISCVEKVRERERLREIERERERERERDRDRDRDWEGTPWKQTRGQTPWFPCLSRAIPTPHSCYLYVTIRMAHSHKQSSLKDKLYSNVKYGSIPQCPRLTHYVVSEKV